MSILPLDNGSRMSMLVHTFRNLMTAAVLAAIMSACGGSSSAPSATSFGASQGYDVTRARVPACTHAGKAVDRPWDMPGDIPVPVGTSFTSSTVLHGARVLKGYVPTSSFDTTVAFFRAQLPRAGYATVDQAAEGNDDAEATFRSTTYGGHWKLHRLDNCRAARIQIAVEKLKITSG